MRESEWFHHFLKRYGKWLLVRLGENVKRVRAQVSRINVSNYLNELRNSLEGVPPENIYDFD